jgi:hypothetical protein
MKYLLCIAFLLIIGCATIKKSFDPVTESEVLRKLEYNAIDAEFKLDTAAIAAIMDDRFISINANSITSKKEELASMYSNISGRLKEGHFVDSFYLDQFRVDFFDNTAVVTFYIVSRGRIKEVPFVNRRTRFYDVWIKSANGWKVISIQATPVPKQ